MLTFAEGWLPPTQRRSKLTATTPTVDQVTFIAQLRLEPLPFVDEIDDLVQQRLQKRPDMAERRVRLTTGEGGALCIHVDQQTFDAVDDIPDLQVRVLIQDAIREWEGG